MKIIFFYKIKLLYFLLLLCSFNLYSQSIHLLKTTTYKSYIHCNDSTESGGIIAAINVFDNIEFPKCSGVSNIPQDCYVVKLDSNFNEVWRKCIGTLNGDDNPSFIKYLPDSTSLVVLTSNRNASYISTLIKLSKTGEKIWEKEIYDSGQCNCYRFVIKQILVKNSEIILFANIWGIERKFGIIKLDSNGNILWLNRAAGNTNAVKIIPTEDSGFIGIGNDYHSYYFSNPDYHISGSCDDYKGISGNDIIIFKTDSFGNQLWQRCIGGGGQDNAIDFIMESDSTFYILSYSNSYDYDVSRDQLLDGNYNNYDIWLTKINNYGNVIWSKTYGGSGTEIANKLFINSNGAVIITGITNSTNYDLQGKRPYYYLPYPQPSYELNFDIWILEVAPNNGSINWQYVYEYSGKETFQYVTSYEEINTTSGIFSKKNNSIKLMFNNEYGNSAPNTFLVSIKIPKCEFDKKIDSPIIQNLELKNSSKIIVDNYLNENTILKISAGNSINLLPGFNTMSGSIFKGEIVGGCGNK
jgi:hypothetical protein